MPGHSPASSLPEVRPFERGGAQVLTSLALGVFPIAGCRRPASRFIWTSMLRTRVSAEMYLRHRSIPITISAQQTKESNEPLTDYCGIEGNKLNMPWKGVSFVRVGCSC